MILTSCNSDTGEKLIQRSDDKPGALKKRLTAYHAQTTPILEHYSDKDIIRAVNGNQDKDIVAADVSKLLATLK